jgi:hypothetical protein
MLHFSAHHAEAETGAVVALSVRQQRGSVSSAQAYGRPSPAAATRPRHPLQGGVLGPPPLQGGSRHVRGGGRCQRPAARHTAAAASVRRKRETRLNVSPSHGMWWTKHQAAMHDSQVELYFFQNSSVAIGATASEQVSRSDATVRLGCKDQAGHPGQTNHMHTVGFRLGCQQPRAQEIECQAPRLFQACRGLCGQRIPRSLPGALRLLRHPVAVASPCRSRRCCRPVLSHKLLL